LKNIIEERGVSSSGLEVAKTFTFAPSAKAFQVFIDGIYSDKIRAVIRELWTNAYDAHILAEKREVPFTCTLPTLLYPELIIRDFGPSMSHDTMMTNFTQAFLSSKDNSNDFVGSLGLGRLSAFAYTDSFNVNTYIAGEKRDYAVFINADGIPELALLSHTKTSEEDGFEVRFPVDIKDCQAFWNAAKFTAIGFDVSPIFTNEEVEYFNKRIQGSGWASYENLRGAFARQGCVIYPLDEQAVRELGDFAFIFDMDGIVIDFPIGSLDYNASREALGYNTRTLKSLKNRFQEIKLAITSDAHKIINASKTRYEASITLESLKSIGIHRSILAELKFFGKNVPPHINVKNKSLERHNIWLSHQDMRSESFSFKISRKDMQVFSPNYSSPIFAFKKGTVCVPARIVKYCKDKGISQCYIVSYGDVRGLERMRRILGHPPIIRVETLSRPPVKQSTEKSAQGGFVSVYSITNGNVLREVVDIKKPGFFIEVNRGTISSYGASICLSFIKSQRIVEFDKLVGITFSQINRFEKEGWVNVAPLLKKAGAQLLEKLDLPHKLFYSNLNTSNLLLNSLVEVPSTTLSLGLGERHPLIKIQREALYILEKFTAANRHNYKHIADYCDFVVTPVVDLCVEENEERKRQFLANYPMLKLLPRLCHYFDSCYTPPEEQKIFLDYLKEVRYEDAQIKIAA
jgi:hypothetical protein